MKLLFAIFATAAAALVFDDGAMPGPDAVDALQPRATKAVAHKKAPVAVVTKKPAAALPAAEARETPCTPYSVCVDAITCGVRYGGCYDENFCTGTTSFPVPKVTCPPGEGLTDPFGRGGKRA